MRLSQEIKKCVVFLALMKADGTFMFVGTGFLVLDERKKIFPALVTAKHVLDGIESKGLEEIYVRVNLKNGTSRWYKSDASKWFKDPRKNVDVAIYFLAAPEDWDHSHCLLRSSATIEQIKAKEIDAGDEVYYVGLFTHHHGDLKNIPIVRSGTIAAFPTEQIQVKEYKMDGYLVESRSVGGLSGSPVFVSLGLRDSPNNSILEDKPKKVSLLLLGLIHGHYNHKGETDFEKLNTGIAIVVPIEKLFETIDLALEAGIFKVELRSIPPGR